MMLKIYTPILQVHAYLSIRNPQRLLDYIIWIQNSLLILAMFLNIKTLQLSAADCYCSLQINIHIIETYLNVTLYL
jgi:hypothetical protein